MRIVIVTLLALVAFAANSVLVRGALAQGQIGPAAFGAIRLLSGVMMLAVLLALQGGLGQIFAHSSAASAAALLVYVTGFSFAYVWLDTGTGALILFGGVQITMFAGALLGGERPTMARWAGAGLALLGLALLFGPTAQAPDAIGALLMAAAAVGWGIYTLRGRHSNAPTGATAANFLLATPVAMLIWWAAPQETAITGQGLALAVASGALASGIGYALWYSVLPALRPTQAAIMQLTVPVIALLGGILFLGEALTWVFTGAAVLIITGVLVALRA